VSTSARLLSIGLACFATACGEAEPPPPKQQTEKAAPSPQKVEAAPPPAKAEQLPLPGDEAGAADVLKRYFAAIEASDYEAARGLRDNSGREPSPQQFAANFDRYSEHRATVGTPSLVVEADGWQYVEVPVQRYGKFKDGKTFVNAGTVTLRRRKTGGAWRIFTS
jgi:hypothetical protein